MAQETPNPSAENPTGAPSYSSAPVHSYAHVPQPGAQVDPMKRFVAALIDGVAVVVIASIIGRVAGMIIGSYLAMAVTGLAGLGLYLIRDVAIEGRSLGKKVMGLRVVTAGGGPVTANESIRRNATLAFGYIGSIVAVVPILGWIAAPLIWLAAAAVGLYEGYLVFTNKPRIGDNLAGTHVVAEAQPVVV
jgi:uncharacterized RDD family membrane protein YckC